MNATMSVDEYRKQVRDPAIKRFDEDAAFERALKEKGIGTDTKVATKPERQHIEDDHTEMVAGYLELLMMQGKVTEYTHTANETWDPGWKQKAKNQAKGVRSGIPDFIIVFPKAVLFLELKRPDGGVVSKTQKAWRAALEAAGANYGLAYGYDEAKEVIDSLAYPEKNIKRTLPY
jgi:hypothetical protein